MSVDDDSAPSPVSEESRRASWNGERTGRRFSSLGTQSSNDLNNRPTPTQTSNRSKKSGTFEPLKSRDASQDLPIWNESIVLSCSGGGVRGLCQLYLLRFLFERIAYFEHTLDPNDATSSADSPLFRFDGSHGNSNSRSRFRVPIAEGTYLPCHYFDYIGGTGVGGILAVMFGRLRLSVDEGIRSFESIWRTMGATMSRYDRVVPFRKAKTSNSLGLDRAFKELLSDRKRGLDDVFRLYKNSFDLAMGRDAVSDEFASDPELCKTIVIAMPDKLEDGLQRPFLFRSYDEQGEGLSLTRVTSGSPTAIRINDICRATSAAPGFFKGVHIGDVKYRDGAIWRNNPALEIYRGINECNTEIKRPVKMLVSLGSGPTKPRKFYIPTQPSTKYHKKDSSIDRVLSQKLDDGYWSFEGPSDLSDLEINEWRIDGSGYKTFERIQKSTESYYQQKPVKERIERLAEDLVRLRQSRARTKRWERFALGIQYTCRASPTCSSHSEKFDDRDSFMDHLMWEHNEPPQDEANWNRIQQLFADSQTTTVK